MGKGVDIEMAPLDEDHVRAKITWSEQDVGGGKLVNASLYGRRVHESTVGRFSPFRLTTIREVAHITESGDLPNVFQQDVVISGTSLREAAVTPN